MVKRPRHGDDDEDDFGQSQRQYSGSGETGPISSKSQQSQGGPPIAIGSMVHYHPGDGDPGPHPGEEPLAAIVASVLSEDAVNLMVIAADGATYGKQGVLFCRKGEDPMGMPYCDVPGHEADSSHDDDDEEATPREKAKELADQLASFRAKLAQAKQAREERKQQRAAAKQEAKQQKA